MVIRKKGSSTFCVEYAEKNWSHRFSRISAFDLRLFAFWALLRSRQTRRKPLWNRRDSVNCKEPRELGRQASNITIPPAGSGDKGPEPAQTPGTYLLSKPSKPLIYANKITFQDPIGFPEIGAGYLVPQGRNPAFSRQDQANDHWEKTDYDYDNDNETLLQALQRNLSNRRFFLLV